MTTNTDLSCARWRKSTYSNGSGGNCVEVADNIPSEVPVRDSKWADGPVLLFSACDWGEFVSAVKVGRFSV
ncbi:hypothetical protein DB35_23060 [Streptomyces abyssalis]|uniref:DUF397 domain-containing protein n=1 Tax=Streptomyces abyssalis TaxID=933944 RepID=A0A1E7JP55_9ACTN|nr:DUF397 domain-containing protein [Streptomyces abyssalis]OEU86588.1 hypothetical protein DB35_23060 [Streptomyces abyssalis]OEU90025.1 hypothetical protein AN215_10460 [Streptomyces abyssalis]